MIRLFDSPVTRRHRRTDSHLHTSDSNRTEVGAPEPQAGHGKVVIPSSLLQSYAGLYFGAKRKAPGSASPITNVANPAGRQPAERMTFDDFLALVKENPRKYIPTTKQYFVQGLASWGVRQESVLGEKINIYNFANKPWLPDAVQDKEEFCGQEQVIDDVVETLKKLDHGKAPYVIQMVGPNGVGKSQLVNIMQEAVEAFSRKPGGERYSFSVISAEKKSKGVELLLPGRRPQESNGQNPDSKLPKEADIVFRLPSALNINPIFLLSPEERGKLIKSLKAEGKLDSKANYDFFLTGGALDQRSEKLIEALKRHYDGDLNKVFQNHIQIERLYFPQGIIPAAETPHAEIRQLAPEVQWNQAPRAILNSGALLDYNGYLPKANNGSINIDDMGRSARTDFTYLLETAQTGRLLLNAPPGHPMTSIQEPVDIIFFSTANPEGLMNIMKGGNWRALKDRTVYIMVPHERRYRSEAKVYQSHFNRALANGRKIAPHVAEIYALWATMTRLLPVNPDYVEYSRSPDARQAEGGTNMLKASLQKMDLLKKALLYQEDADINSFQKDATAADYIKPNEYEMLRRNLKIIAREHRQSTGETNFSDYEGGMGISARDGDKVVVPAIIERHAHTGQPITVLDVFETLAEYLKKERLWVKEREVYLEKHPLAKKTPNVTDLLKMVESYARRQFLMEVRNALQVYQPDHEHVRILEKYLEHLRASKAESPAEQEVRREYRDPINQKEPNLKFMEQVESAILTKSTTALPLVRTRLLAKLTAWDPNATSSQNIMRLFAGEMERMRAYDEKASEDRIKLFLKDTALWQTNPTILEREATEQPERKREIDRMKQGLVALEKLGYPPEVLPKLLGWAFGKGYLSQENLEVYGT
jgi:hypothetical protein